MRDIVMSWIDGRPPVGGAANLEGRWSIAEEDEAADDPSGLVVDFQDGTMFRDGSIIGRYLVFERHIELWQDRLPLIILWRDPFGGFTGAQEYQFAGELPYRVKIVMTRVRDDRQLVEPELSLRAA